MNERSKILVVDDDETIRETVAAILEDEGYNVSTAQDGKEALDKCNTEFYNLALIDIRLPDMDGTELLKLLPETTPPMVKIIVTGYPSLQNAVKAVNHGADAYLLKPVEAEEILKTIRLQLEKQQQAREYSEQKVAEFIQTRVKELENQKKMNEELEKMREEVGKTASEKAKLRELELEKKLADTQKALEDAQRKTRQGSQQLQGEVMELNLEDQLKETFPYDEFLPIPKGIEGADIWQKVKNKHGQEAGLFVWEIKRTKAFSKGWLPKLREDCRKVNGSVSILITDTLPDTISYFGREAGVWICSFEYALVLANVLRDSLLQLAIAKSSASHKDEHLQEIYDYITSEAFRHKIEAHFESVKTLKIDLDSEKRAMERIWKKREVEIQRLDKSMSQMFGEIQGVVGPQLEAPRNLEIEAGEEIEE